MDELLDHRTGAVAGLDDPLSVVEVYLGFVIIARVGDHFFDSAACGVELGGLDSNVGVVLGADLDEPVPGVVDVDEHGVVDEVPGVVVADGFGGGVEGFVPDHVIRGVVVLDATPSALRKRRRVTCGRARGGESRIVVTVLHAPVHAPSLVAFTVAFSVADLDVVEAGLICGEGYAAGQVGAVGHIDL